MIRSVSETQVTTAAKIRAVPMPAFLGTSLSGPTMSLTPTSTSSSGTTNAPTPTATCRAAAMYLPKKPLVFSAYSATPVASPSTIRATPQISNMRNGLLEVLLAVRLTLRFLGAVRALATLSTPFPGLIQPHTSPGYYTQVRGGWSILKPKKHP